MTRVFGGKFASKVNFSPETKKNLPSYAGYFEVEF